MNYQTVESGGKPDNYDSIFMEVIMKLNPRKDYILLEKSSTDNITSSGIVIASNEDTKTSVYDVISVGDDITSVEPGDKVVTHTHTGNNVRFEGNDYKFVKQADILAIVVD